VETISVLKRQTQTVRYWAEDFQIGRDDIDHIYTILLERETPLSTDELALALVRYRVQQEEEGISQRLTSSNVYQPKNAYEIAAKITFPALGFATGEVIDKRSGLNPEYGSFQVLQVEMDSGETREFASELQGEHVLNISEEDLAAQVETLLTPEEIFIEHGGDVADAIEEHLVNHDDLVLLAGRWFPKSLLAEVHVGHLNLAEAVLDMAGGGPMSMPDILEQIGMMEDINIRLAEFSMNYALQEDERFDEVGPAGKVLWYLTRMEPEDVRTTPPRLDYRPIDYDEAALTEELSELVLEIDDEHSPIPPLRRRIAPDSTTITLTYPHLCAGTLPLSSRLRPLFPMAYEAPRIRFVLVDDETGEEMPGWVVRHEGYVFGMDEWYEANAVPVGGYVTITRTEDPERVRIACKKRRPRSEWVRRAMVDGNRLRFDMHQKPIGCEYDDLTILAVLDAEAVDKLWHQTTERDTPLLTLMRDIMPELAKLNPQGTVHARTLYSAVNLVRRCPPEPIFAQLASSPDFEHVGGPYWRLKSGE
jgi:hypothetical protein